MKSLLRTLSEQTQKQMAAKWGNCSRFTISRSLKKLGFTRKKKHMVIKNYALPISAEIPTMIVF